MNETVYVVMRHRNLAGQDEVHGVFSFRENALAEARHQNRTVSMAYFTVEAHRITPFIPCDLGPCWDAWGHAGDCMAES